MKYIDRLVEIINIHRNHKDLTYEQVKAYITQAFKDLVSSDEVSAKVLEYQIDLHYSELAFGSVNQIDLHNFDLDKLNHNH